MRKRTFDLSKYFIRMYNGCEKRFKTSILFLQLERIEAFAMKKMLCQIKAIYGIHNTNDLK